MTDSIFTNNTPSVEQPPEKFFETLVGEGKKFSDPEQLARGKWESDKFIEKLQEELSGMRQELNTKLTLEQYIDRMADSQNRNSPPPPNEPNSNGGNEDLQGLKPEDVNRLIEQRISERETERIQAENLRTVKDTLTQSLGPEFATKLKSIAQDLGMTEEDMTNMAKTKPKALIALVGVQGTKNPSQELFTPPSGQRTQINQSTPDRTFKYYENIRKTDPKTYWTPSVQNQMMKDASRLMEKFYD